MNRTLRWAVSVLCGLGGLLLFIAPAAAQRPLVEDVADELLVGFHQDVSDADADNELNAHGATKLEKIRGLKVHRVRVPPQAMAAIERALARRSGVAFVERNKKHSLGLTANDPLYAQSYHLPKIMAPQAWDITTGNPDVIIAILDSGVDGQHQDLAGKLVPGTNTFNSDPPTVDPFGHGTKVAGAAAAISNNAIGATGVAWQNKIMPVRVSDASGFATSSAIAAGMTWAADHGAKVINLSFNGIAGSITIKNAAQYANSRGVVVVAAAGNCGCTDTTADNPYIISVSATDANDNLISISSRGNYVDISAPGSFIRTTAPGNTYSQSTGTSFASPITAGVVALMLSVNPSLTPDDVDVLLKANADEKGTTGWDPSFGYGRLNAFRAVSAARDSLPSSSPTSPPPTSPPPPPPPTVDLTPPPDVATFSVTAPSGTQTALAWVNPSADFSGTIVLSRVGTPVAESPIGGQTYAAGQTVGASTVAYVGASPTFSHTNLTAGLTYHYRVFSFDAAKNYAAGVAGSVTTPGSTACPTEVIIDNLPAGQTSSQILFTGKWAASTAAAAFGVNASLYSSGTGTNSYTWKSAPFNTAGTCSYEVFAWWTANTNRGTAVSFTVAGHQAGSTGKTVNQQTNGGKWNSLGTYTWNASTQGQVTVSGPNSPQASADAVRFVLVATTTTSTTTATAPEPPPPTTTEPAPTTSTTTTLTEVIVDNGQPGTTFTGKWCASSGPSPYGGTSLYSCGSAADTYRWSPSFPSSGDFDVYIWWTANVNRTTAAPVKVQHANGNANMVVNQQINGGKWNLLGRYTFNGAGGFVELGESAGQTSADAVRFVPAGSPTPPPQSP